MALVGPCLAYVPVYGVPPGRPIRPESSPFVGFRIARRSSGDRAFPGITCRQRISGIAVGYEGSDRTSKPAERQNLGRPYCAGGRQIIELCGEGKNCRDLHLKMHLGWRPQSDFQRGDCDFEARDFKERTNRLRPNPRGAGYSRLEGLETGSSGRGGDSGRNSPIESPGLIRKPTWPPAEDAKDDSFTVPDGETKLVSDRFVAFVSKTATSKLRLLGHSEPPSSPLLGPALPARASSEGGAGLGPLCCALHGTSSPTPDTAGR